MSVDQLTVATMTDLPPERAYGTPMATNGGRPQCIDTLLVRGDKGVSWIALGNGTLLIRELYSLHGFHSHFFLCHERDYQPWLDLAVHLTHRQATFVYLGSGTHADSSSWFFDKSGMHLSSFAITSSVLSIPFLGPIFP